LKAEEVGNTATRPDLPVDIDLTKYVAGGIVVFDLNKAMQEGISRWDPSSAMKWSTHLDLTTDAAKLRAYIYASPTVVDLDGDKSLDILVGTSVGFIYALDKIGETLPGFPVQIGEIQGQLLVEDVTGDAALDIVAADSNGNVVCFSKTGEEQWHRRISGFASQGATAADVNGDGRLDVLVATTTGHIWALNGKDGEPLKNFPIKTGGRIIAPILPIRLGNLVSKGMQLVVPSFDGRLYIVDGDGTCTSHVDLGETSYSMALADDLTGDGKLDVVVSTMAGNVYCFGTNSPFDPLHAWQSQSPLQVTSGEWRGVRVHETSRGHRDVIGGSFVVQFSIVDQTKHQTHDNQRYEVIMSLGGSNKHVLFQKFYSKAGEYTEVVKSPNHRTAGTVVVRLVNEHGQIHEDSFALSFNVHFYKMLKWLLVGPFTVMAVVLLSFGSLSDNINPFQG